MTMRNWRMRKKTAALRTLCACMLVLLLLPGIGAAKAAAYGGAESRTEQAIGADTAGVGILREVTIGTQPKSTEAAVGTTVKFTVSASGSGTLTYQWQTLAPNATSWKDSVSASAKTATLSVTVQSGHNGYQFRCIVKDAAGSTKTSSAATLTVKASGPAAIVTQPKSTTVVEGSSAKFSVVASGNSLTYQWQTKAPAATTWKNSTSASAKKATFTLTAQAAHNGYQFRCIVTDGSGNTVTSSAAKLTVSEAGAPRITTQPKSATVKKGAIATFKVVATGEGTLSYQWQSIAPGSKTWKDSTSANAKKAAFSLTVKDAHDGYRFRCVVTDSRGRSVTSTAVTLKVKPLVNATDVTIYVIRDEYKDVLSLPADKSDTFRLVADGTDVTFYEQSGWNCDLTADGVISVRYSEVYNLTTGKTEMYPRTGDSVVICRVDGETVTINVHAVDYAVVYADEKVAEYVNKYIKSGMTDMQKMEAIAAYPASFNYDYHYSSYVSMILYGGGDCWASTSLIIRECEMLGIDAWSRNGNKDGGAGSGHRNAMVQYNGVYYMLEAGYTGDAPRYYDVTVRTSLYSTRQRSDGSLSIYQYDGHLEELGDVWKIPNTIDGKKVTVIEDSFAYAFKGTEIILPKYLESIGNYAFTGCTNLTTLQIPSKVLSVGYGAFAQATNLVLTVDSANKYLTVRNNCLYSKDLTILYEAPSASGKLSLPSALKEISPYVFYYNTNVTEIVVPAGVTTIGEGAFGNCSSLTKITFNGNNLTKLESFIFAYTGSLAEITIPASVTDIDTFAFVYAGPINVILKSTQAPTWSGSVIALGSYISNVEFYVPAGSSGYDSGKWTEVTVKTGTPAN